MTPFNPFIRIHRLPRIAPNKGVFLLLLLSWITSPLLLRSQESEGLEASPVIRGSYAYGISGACCYSTPGSIYAWYADLGYNEAVTADLYSSADLWQEVVRSHSINLEYVLPLKKRDFNLLFGVMLRTEWAERYAEYYYNPVYTFSGIEMTSTGGGIYTGIEYIPEFGRWSVNLNAAGGYFDFSRKFLSYFYLDPLIGSYIEKRQISTDKSSGPGGFFRLGLSYTYHQFTAGPALSMLVTGTENRRFGNAGAGIQLSYSLQ